MPQREMHQLGWCIPLRFMHPTWLDAMAAVDFHWKQVWSEFSK